MQRLLSFSKKPILGLDVNTSYVSLLGLTRYANQIQCERFALRSLDSHEKRTRQDASSTLIERLKQSASQSGGTVKTVATALSGASTRTKIVTLPANLTEMALENHVLQEAAEQFSDLGDNLSVDFQIMCLNHHDPDCVDVLMVACDQAAVSNRVSCLKQAGLNAKIVDVDVYALQRASAFYLDNDSQQCDHQTTAFVHLMRDQAILAVMRDGELVYSKTQPMNNASTLKQAMDMLAVEDWLVGFAQKMSLFDQTVKTQLLSLFAPVVSTQCRQMLQYLYSAKGQKPVAEIVISGEMVLVSGLAEAVEESLNLPVRTANPFLTMPFASRVDASLIKSIGPALMLCMGLALRGVQDD